MFKRAASVQSIEWEKVRSKITRIVIAENSPASNFQIGVLTLNPDIVVVLNITGKDGELELLREKYTFAGIINENIVVSNNPVTNTTPRTPKSGDKKITSGILHVGNYMIMIANIGTDSIESVKKFVDEITRNVDILIFRSKLNFGIAGFVSVASESPDGSSLFVYVSKKICVKNAFTNLTVGFPRCVDIDASGIAPRDILLHSASN